MKHTDGHSPGPGRAESRARVDAERPALVGQLHDLAARGRLQRELPFALGFDEAAGGLRLGAQFDGVHQLAYSVGCVSSDRSSWSTRAPACGCGESRRLKYAIA